jgi:hypothetical protein
MAAREAAMANAQAPEAQCQFVIVGDDDRHNFELATLLRRLRGNAAVHRVFQLPQAEELVRCAPKQPLLIFLDLLAFEPAAATDFIGRVRAGYPHVVFNLYVDKEDFRARRQDFPEAWRKRLQHYYRLYRNADVESDFESYARAALQSGEWEALHNVTGEPIRLTPVFQKGLVESDLELLPAKADREITFVSYSRDDWSGFVSKLVKRLRSNGEEVWVDQDYIRAGEDWRDAIGQALDICDTLLLVLSPNSMASKTVKSEYRYFLDQEKRVVPLLSAPLDKLPFDISRINYINFCCEESAMPFDRLFDALARR